MHLIQRILSASVLLVIGGIAAAGQPVIDATTGRAIANPPPARWFDHLHMKLELDIPDMTVPWLRGRETLTLDAIGAPRERLALDAEEMHIEAVSRDGRPLAYSHDGKRLVIVLEPAAVPGEPVDIVIEYTLDDPTADGNGLRWSTGDPAGEGETARAPQIQVTGQPKYNRRWYACHDFPNERLTTELIVTVDGKFQVCSNGRLVGKGRSEDGRTVWRWLQDKPHVNYLVTLVIGRFDIVGVGGPGSARPGLAMPVYVPVGAGEHAKEVFAATPKAIAFLEELFDEPYPWDKYAQLCVRNFNWGGMENTSATMLSERAALAKPGTQDNLIVHEAAHQWTGDLLTCKSWGHLWLNEGWATYSVALWQEHLADEADKDSAYMNVVRRWYEGQRRSNRTTAPNDPAMVSTRYLDSEEVFSKANNPYSKGAFMLHMLRMQLGDELFFRATHEYIDRFKFKEVETDDFRGVFEDVSGVNLERFFGQWAYRPGMPRLSVDFKWFSESGELSISVEQTQTLNADNPAFAFELPVEITTEDGASRMLTVWVDQRISEQRFTLDSPPSKATVDPKMTVLAGHEIRKDLN